MSRKHPFQPADFLPRDGDVLAGLRRMPVASDFSAPAVTLVLAMRLMACSIAAGRDPLVEIARRLHSLAAARAVLDFAEACSRFWPDRAVVARPCCHGLTPDETAFAQMAEAAGSADRAGFSAVLDGLVRRDRHERLYTATQQAYAAISAES